MENKELERKVSDAKKLLKNVKEEISKRIVGQDSMIDGILMGIIGGGHVLIEGVPGLAKTLAVQTLSEALSIDFKRIQFTPDLLPADLTGTMIYRQQTGEFVARKGPVFTNIVLADEINRAPAKVQAALLESMAEKQVTIGDSTYRLPDPFFVLATQNPIEQEGTYQLPEAQLDRFALKLKIQYPSAAEELQILKKMGNEKTITINRILNAITLNQLRRAAESITVDERIEKYIVSIITASRAVEQKHLSFSRYIEYGASPRATIYLYRCARVQALFEGRTFVLPEDVKAVAYDVLRHRIVLSYEAQAEELSTDDVIKDILAAVSVP